MANPKYSHPLDTILDRPVAFQRAFKTITRNTVAALFLSQAWYWSKRHNDDDGWFYNTQEDWEEETGLTRFEQETARKVLKRLGILEEKRVGVPAKLYYRLDKERIAQMLDFQIAVTPQTGFSSLGGSSNQECGDSTIFNRYSETATENKSMGDGESAVTSTDMGADAPARASSQTPEERMENFPQDCRAGARLMFEVFRLLPPERPAPTAKGGDFALWINGIRDLEKLAKDYAVPLEKAMRLAHAHWNRAPFNLAHPGALKKVMASALAQAASQNSKPSTSAVTPLADQLKSFKPRGSQ